MGGISEKLLTLDEAARRLSLPADDVELLIQEGELPAFRLGGRHLRIRLADLEALQLQRTSESENRKGPKPVDPHVRSAIPGKNLLLQSSLPVRQAGTLSISESPLWDRVVDFLYFNDFYLVGILIFLTLLAVIFTL